MEENKIREEITEILKKEDDAVWGKRVIDEKVGQIIEILRDENYSFIKGILKAVEKRIEDRVDILRVFKPKS